MDAHHSSRVSLSEAQASQDNGAVVVALHGASRKPRSPLREERHPNSVTAPPLNRGSMPPLPWRGFWNSIGTAVLSRLTGRGGQGPAAPAQAEAWQGAAQRRRWTFALLTVLSTTLATTLFAGVQPDYDNAWLGYGQMALFALLSAWVVTGFMTGMMGFWVMVRGDRHALSAKSVASHTLAPDARTAIIMPICNEDVATVFAGLRATCESVAATGHGTTFDVFVLSDSYDPEIAKAERAAWEDLRTALAEHAQQPQVAQPGVARLHLQAPVGHGLGLKSTACA